MRIIRQRFVISEILGGIFVATGVVGFALDLVFGTGLESRVLVFSVPVFLLVLGLANRGRQGIDCSWY